MDKKKSENEDTILDIKSRPKISSAFKSWSLDTAAEN